jgi:hypothetical protein
VISSLFAIGQHSIICPKPDGHELYTRVEGKLPGFARHIDRGKFREGVWQGKGGPPGIIA